MRRTSTRRGVAVDPASDPMAPPAYRIRAMVDGLDEVAHAMERKWGVGRLRLLVSDLLRAKFDEQIDRLDAAIASGDENRVRVQAAGMHRAWLALDRAAHEAGQRPLAPQVWECVLPDTGEVVSLVRTEAEALHVAREGRVFTTGEVAILIASLSDTVLEMKRQFPGAAVTGIQRTTPLDWGRGDPLPF